MIILVNKWDTFSPFSFLVILLLLVPNIFIISGIKVPR